MNVLDDYVGGEVYFGFFRKFVKDVLSPHFNMPFIDERELQYNLWYSWFKEQFSKDEVCRGGGKSEFGIWGIIYCAIFQPINKFSGMREKEFLVVSADNTTVLELNKRIADYFLSSDNLKQFVPDSIGRRDQKNERWNATTLELKNGSKIHFRSVKTKRGLHVDRIWIDDPTTESSTLKDTETIDFVLGAILPMGNRKKAIVNFTGTPLRYTDILSYIGNLPNYVSNKYPLLNDKGEIYLNNSFDEEQIENIRKTIGSRKFSAEYLLNPIADEVSLIRRNWIEACLNEDLSISEVKYDELYMGVDFAFSDAITADKSAFVEVGITYNTDGSVKNLILMNIEWAKGLSLNQHWDKIENKYKVNRHELILLEENSIKGSVKDLRAINLPFMMYWMGNRDAQTEKQSTFRSKTISKINAINRLATTFEFGKWIIPYKTEREKEIANRFINECTSWALEEEKLVEYGIHPDAPIGAILINETVHKIGGVH
jgi:hypothetical protein